MAAYEQPLTGGRVEPGTSRVHARVRTADIRTIPTIPTGPTVPAIPTGHAPTGHASTARGSTARVRTRRVPTADLSLLQGFELRLDGQPVELPLAAQRLVAFLALHKRPVQRGFVAGNLWLESSEERAAANLRSALWRLHRHGRPLVDTQGGRLSLASDVRVDIRDVSDQARQLVEGRHEEEQAAPALDELSLSGELLPDWYEDWILVEREKFRQLRLHALETLCDTLAEAGRYAQAIEAGLAAVAAEPLRESAHRALIRCYLAEGNPAEAVRQYRRYEKTLAEELGTRPSAQMQQLMAGAGVRPASGDDAARAGASPAGAFDDDSQTRTGWEG